MTAENNRGEQHIVSFPFRLSYYEAITELSAEDQLRVFNAICEYAFFGRKVELEGLPRIVMTLIKPNIACSVMMYVRGSKGGRPRKAPKVKTTSETSAETTTETTDKTTTETSAETTSETSAKTSAKTDIDIDRDRDRDRESDRDRDGGGTPRAHAQGDQPPPPPPLIPDVVAKDSLPPPVSLAEAMAYADRIGMRPADAEQCWDHFQATDWQNEKIKDKPVRLSRDAAFAKMRRWKVRQARIDATDAAKRPASVSVAHEVKDYGESDTGGEI